jgi:hypothetical protein
MALTVLKGALLPQLDFRVMNKRHDGIVNESRIGCTNS